MGSTLGLEPGDSPVVWERRFGDGVLARAFGASLDASLAAGRAPESSRLLAARARQVVALSERRSVAGSWEHLLRVAHRARRARRLGVRVTAAAVPVQAERIVAAEPVIRDLIGRLAVPLPVPARGVAMARVLLSDAAGPVYSRRAGVGLAAAVEAAAAQLDPALPLAASPRG